MIARLRDRDAFLRIRREGERVRAGHLWCAVVADPSLPHTQVGFAIGRNVGTAVTRNRLRRRLRSVLSSVTLPAGLLLIGARPGAGELTFGEVRDTLVQLVADVERRVAPS